MESYVLLPQFYKILVFDGIAFIMFVLKSIFLPPFTGFHLKIHGYTGSVVKKKFILEV